jgi:hypothetical protein
MGVYISKWANQYGIIVVTGASHDGKRRRYVCKWSPTAEAQP